MMQSTESVVRNNARLREQILPAGVPFPSSRVRLSGGKLAVLDGPFTETKEVVGGYAVMEFNSREAAVRSAVEFMELHKKYWKGRDGETEVRQIFAPDDYTFETGRLQIKAQQ